MNFNSRLIIFSLINIKLINKIFTFFIKKLEKSSKFFGSNYFITKIFKTNIVIFCIYLFLSFVVYFKLWRSYFTQDEWYYFGLFNKYIDNPFGFISIFIDQFRNIRDFGIHVTPLWNSIFFLEYQILGLKFQYYALLSIFLHALSALLVYSLSKKLTKERYIGFLSGLYFTINYSHYEAVTWANTHLQSQIPLILIVIAYKKWLQHISYLNTRIILQVLFLFTVGVFIRENVISMVLLLPFFHYLYGDIKRRKQVNLIILSYIFVYCLYRLGIPYILKFTYQIDLKEALPYGMFDFPALIFRIPFYSIKALIQQYLSIETIVKLSEYVTLWNYPALYAPDYKTHGYIFASFINSAGSDLTMMMIAIPFLGILILSGYITKRESQLIYKTLIVCLGIIITSIMSWLFLVPYLLTVMPSMSFIPSRQLYLTSIGSSLLLIIIVKIYIENLHKKYIKSISAAFIVIICLSPIFIREIIMARNNIKNNILEIGEQRRIITDYIKAVYPKLPNQVMFYIIGNQQFFGFAIPSVPFQTNFGVTLLNLYQRDMHYDLAFFNRKFLIDKGPMGEGYMESSGKGFGYYVRGKTLLDDIVNYKLSSENVIIFTYDGFAKIIQESSEEIRKRIDKELYYRTLSKNWTEYRIKTGTGSFVVPEGFFIEESADSEKIIINLKSKANLERYYKLIIFKNSNKIFFDNFIYNYIDDEENLKFDDYKTKFIRDKVYFSNMEKSYTAYLKKDTVEYNFFYHPTDYHVIYLVKKYSPADDKILPMDLILWLLSFYTKESK